MHVEQPLRLLWLEQSPGIGWEALTDTFIPLGQVLRALNREGTVHLFSFPIMVVLALLPQSFLLSLSQRISSISFPSVSSSATVTFHSSRGHHGSMVWCPITSHLSALLCVVQCCHLFGCCSLNIKLQQQQQSQGPRSWTKTHKTLWLSKVS